MQLEIYDAARARIAQNGLSARMETKLALFLSAAKNINAIFLGASICQPTASPAQHFLYLQYCEELQAIGLLARVTRWLPEPDLYAGVAWLVAPISSRLTSRLLLPVAFHGEHALLSGLAMGHALLSLVRLTPVLPRDIDELEPFVVALRYIERNNARLLQTQIRLLRLVGLGLPLSEREAIIEDNASLVADVFCEFLFWMCQDEPRPPPTVSGRRESWSLRGAACRT